MKTPELLLNKKKEDMKEINEIEMLNIDGGKDKLVINPKIITAIHLTNSHRDFPKSVNIYTSNTYSPIAFQCASDKDTDDVFEKLRLVTKLI